MKVYPNTLSLKDDLLSFYMKKSIHEVQESLSIP